MTDAPVSRLDARIDDLVRSLGLLPPPILENFIKGMRTHEYTVGMLPADYPGIVDVIAAADVRKAFLAIAVEVQNLRHPKGT